MNARELSAQAARHVISDAQLTAFLRTVRERTDVPAIALINDQLDAGTPLEAILYDGERFGFILVATKVSERVFRIRFGHQTNLLAGNGGKWRVEFDPAGRVASGEEAFTWVS
jgi:hypothetical protein